MKTVYTIPWVGVSSVLVPTTEQGNDYCKMNEREAKDCGPGSIIEGDLVNKEGVPELDGSYVPRQGGLLPRTA